MNGDLIIDVAPHIDSINSKLKNSILDNNADDLDRP